MKQKVFDTMDAAVADIPDGSTIMFTGFAGPGTPRNLIAALRRQGAKDLTVIANTPGRWNDAAVDVGELIAARQVRKAIASFTASPHPSMRTAFSNLYEAGEIEAELVPQGTLAERIRAGGAGIGAFYTPTGAGTDLAEGKEVRRFDGRDYVLEMPLKADYAFVRALRADTLGNLQYRYSQRNYAPIMASAARITIVEVEEPVAEPGTMEPEYVQTPSIFVDRIVQIPADGIWDIPGGQG